jgi:hypothetical protein
MTETATHLDPADSRPATRCPSSRARQVTQGTQNIENLDVSPDGAWLYYDSDRNGNSISGGNRIAVAHRNRYHDPAPDFDPSVSPDGNEVAFHRNLNGDREIFIAPVSGGSEFRLTTRRAMTAGPVVFGWNEPDLDRFVHRHRLVCGPDNGSWEHTRPGIELEVSLAQQPVWSSRGRAFIVVTAAAAHRGDLNTGAALPIAPRFDGVSSTQDVRHHSGRAARSVEDPDVIYGMPQPVPPGRGGAVELETGKHR